MSKTVTCKNPCITPEKRGNCNGLNDAKITALSVITRVQQKFINYTKNK